jgi:MFS family permease
MPFRNAFAKRLQNLSHIYHEYPSQFWVLILATFIDRLGGALMFPFFTLYITRKFGVGMTQVGVIFGLFSISSVAGSMFGGALTDRLGRKGMLLFGLIVSALSSLLMGLVNAIELFFVVTLFVGLLANAGGPAQQAMVADLLPAEKRAQGFGLLRVVVNLSITIGPMIGGLLAARSYMLLFVCDAVASLITAAIVYLGIQETRPAADTEGPEETMAQTFRGYADVLRDAAFFWFLGASMLMVLVYMQMNSTLAVYLRDVHGVSEQAFGYILSLNAAIVVLFQFPVTRWVDKYRPLVVMTVGSLLYAVGFALYGFVSLYVLFLGAMVIITIGEMFVSPVGQAIVSQLAPEDMRGRYMAVYGFSWIIPSAVGPLLAGLVMDYADPDWVWYGAGLIGLIAMGAFWLLERQVGHGAWTAVDERLSIMQRLEEDEISAQEAAELLAAVERGKLATLASPGADSEKRHLRIRVSDLASGTIKTDLRLPLGLVNTILHAEGRLAPNLDHLDSEELRSMLSMTAADASEQTMETDDDERIDISVE